VSDDTRRDRPANRREAAAEVNRANGLGAVDGSPVPPTILDELAKHLREQLPAGRARKAWDAAGRPGEASLVIAHKVLSSRLVVVLEAEKRARKHLHHYEPTNAEIEATMSAYGCERDEAVARLLDIAAGRRDSAVSYLAEIRRGTSQVQKLVGQLVNVAKVHSDITITGMPDEVRIVGVSEILDSFGQPGPTGDAPPRHTH